MSEPVGGKGGDRLPVRRIAVLGAGALGSFYAGRLQKAGDSLALVVRRDAELLRTGGILFSGREEAWRFHPDRVETDPRKVGEVDVVIVAMKATGNGSLAELLPPLVGPETVVVTLQNGLGSEEVLAGLAPGRTVLGMLCFVAVSRKGPAEVEVFHPGSVALGRHGGAADAVTREFAERMRRAGIPAKVSDNLPELRWRKLVWNVPFNGLSIAAGCLDTARILAQPELVQEVHGLMAEVVAIAGAHGCVVPPEFVKSQVDVTPGLGAYRPSSLIDFEAGRPVELEAIWGEPLRRARAAGVAVPRLERLYASLRALLGVGGVAEVKEA